MKFKTIASEVYPGFRLKVLTKDEFLREAPDLLYNQEEINHLASTYYTGPSFEIRQSSYEVDYSFNDFFNVAIAFKANAASLGHLVYTCGFAKKQDIYTLERSDLCLASNGLASGQASILESILKRNSAFDFISWFKDTKGRFHVNNRLPDEIEINGNFDIGNFFEAKRIPRKLTVVGTVTDFMLSGKLSGKSLTKDRLPAELNVTESMSVTNTKFRYLPDKLSVAGCLSISTIQKIGSSCDCHTLMISAVEGKPATISLGKVTIGEGGVTIEGSTGAIKNIHSLGDVTIRYNDTCESITNIKTNGSLAIYRSLALIKLGPDIECCHLSIFRGNIEDISEVTISDSLSLERSHSTKLLPPNLFLQHLKIQECDNLQLPAYGVVYGDMTVPKHVSIPATFCCLGNVVTGS